MLDSLTEVAVYFLTQYSRPGRALSPQFNMYYREDRRSQKPIKSLEKVLLPYRVTFPVNAGFGVNGKYREVPAGVEVELTQGEFEALLTSELGKYL